MSLPNTGSRPRKQHVISQVLLRRFVDPALGRVQEFDLRSGRSHPAATAGVGYLEEFIRSADAVAAERRWHAMEQRLPRALSSVDDRSLMSSPSDMATIRECFAIHWGRSRMVLEVHRRHREPAVVQARREIVEANLDPLLEEFILRRGHAPASKDDLVALAEEMLPYDEAMLDSLFTNTVHENVDEALARLEHEPLAILIPGGTPEFLIGDIPALTLGTSRAGPLGGVTWEQADSLVLPLGPRAQVVFRSDSGFREIEGRVVDKLNRHQVREALERIVYRPGAGMDPFIKSARQSST